LSFIVGVVLKFIDGTAVTYAFEACVGVMSLGSGGGEMPRERDFWAKLKSRIVIRLALSRVSGSDMGSGSRRLMSLATRRIERSRVMELDAASLRELRDVSGAAKPPPVTTTASSTVCVGNELSEMMLRARWDE